MIYEGESKTLSNLWINMRIRETWQNAEVLYFFTRSRKGGDLHDYKNQKKRW